MPLEPVKIPQNVYVEDRIIGPITLRQIIIVMVSAGISYAIWASMKSADGTVSGVKTGLAWTPTIIGIIFAFVKINGISLTRIIMLLIERIEKPARRVWMPRQGIYINIVTNAKADTENRGRQATQEHKEEGRIEELSKVLDKGPPEDEEETQAVRPVNPDRVQAETRRKPVDDITEQPRLQRGGGGLLRDITPPPSHA